MVTVFRERGVTNADYLWIMTAYSFKAKDRALFKKPGWEGFKGVLYYNKTSKYPNCRWFVDSSQASLTAFSGMANDVYYTRDEP